MKHQQDIMIIFIQKESNTCMLSQLMRNLEKPLKEKSKKEWGRLEGNYKGRFLDFIPYAKQTDVRRDAHVIHAVKKGDFNFLQFQTSGLGKLGNRKNKTKENKY